MATANGVVDWVTLGIYVILGGVALRQWLRRRDEASGWVALAFGWLAATVALGPVLPDDPGAVVERVERVLILSLVLFPYFLYRFMRTFRRRTGPFDRLVIPLTVGLSVATVLLPSFPGGDEPRPWWFLVYLVVFLFHWTLLTVLVTARLWRAGAGQAGVARRRMRWLAVASAALTVTIFVAAATPGDDGPLELATGLGASFSGLAFLLGVAPPPSVRNAWRRPEQERFGDAVTRLMRATDERQAAAEVLPVIAGFVGAAAGTLLDADGNVLASQGRSDLDQAAALRIPFEGGALLLWTSRYAPWFSGEELRLAHNLAALTGLALDRSRLFAQERRARHALERADELKTQFVALAAHELRTPVGNLWGTVDTLDRLGDRLSEEERGVLRGLLRTQTERLRLLTEQLLDLSRLEAEAVALRPVPLRVRERVEEIVAGTVGAGRIQVEITIEPELEALVDAEAFDRVVSNLVANALRYGEPPVTVSAEQRDRHFRVTVADRGQGVSPEFEPLLFERFARGRGSEEGPGTGLGLAIARSYARAHGGDLVYHRVEPTGACFELVLPRRLPNGIEASGPQQP